MSGKIECRQLNWQIYPHTFTYPQLIFIHFIFSYIDVLSNLMTMSIKRMFVLFETIYYHSAFKITLRYWEVNNTCCKHFPRQCHPWFLRFFHCFLLRAHFTPWPCHSGISSMCNIHDCVNWVVFAVHVDCWHSGGMGVVKVGRAFDWTPLDDHVRNMHMKSTDPIAPHTKGQTTFNETEFPTKLTFNESFASFFLIV